MVIVAVYVDDLIIISKTAEEMRTIKKNLSARFKMKDMGRLHYCLGVNIEQDESNKCLWIHQKQYILKLIDKYGLSEAKTVSTPGAKLKKSEETSGAVNQTEYQSLVGSLLYTAIANKTRHSTSSGSCVKI